MVRCAILILLAIVAIEATPLNHQTFAPMWNEFKQTHGKSYSTVAEEIARFNIFIENQRQIDAHNEEFKAGLHTFEVGMNQFGDMTNEEFRSQMNGFVQSAKPAATSIFQAAVTDIPDSVDWRPKGYVTPVKNQAQCGSCWAFSATGGLEGQHFKKTGKLVSLSEQNLVDCSGKQGNQGCQGGLMDQAFTYIKVNNGIDTEDSYPYQARNGQCRFNASNVGATDTGFTDIKSGDESDLTNAIATVGPISVAIDASKLSFQFYKKGVYYAARCSSTNLDHGVLAVGYGATSDGTKYYIVKNSWKASWGDQGYILMSRDRNNNCGIATSASYPLV
jgi:cathepsin L